ncbi:MAG TPA: hypothetical protein VK663_09275, partial [Burkholderiales bacterium]|nr:hypothetical protein [Burkholderiales bacterium]
ADAMAILRESGQEGRHVGLYGVWASDGLHSRLWAERVGRRWRLNGVKQYCSAAIFANAALITAHSENGILLFEIPVPAHGIHIEPSTWATPAFSTTETRTLTFTDMDVTDDDLVGAPDWYLTRPGFWHGAIGPAACWAGGAVSLVDAASAVKRDDPHFRAQLGALHAASWGLRALLDVAGREIDEDPRDIKRQARRRALFTRHLIERCCTDVLDRFGRATGPQLMAFDAHVANQCAELALYIRQCHAEHDLETIVQQ